MFTLASLSAPLLALGLIGLGAPLSAEPPFKTGPAQERGDWIWEQASSQAPKTWYVMIAVHQAVGPAGCDTYRYKVSTIEPIVITGPPEVRAAHGDELSAWWMMFVRERAPIPYRWLTTSAGHEPPQVYFRESAEEVRQAFRADGHLRQSRSCSGSKLVGLRTRKFQFTPPPGFASVDFGNEPVPQGVTVARNLGAVPGAQ